MNIVLVLGILIIPALVLGSRETRRDLRSLGARDGAFVLATSALGVAAVGVLLGWAWGLAQVGIFWLPALLVVPWVIALWQPRLLVFATGGPLPSWRLANDCRRITRYWNTRARKGAITDPDRAWLRQASSALEKWRTAETSELIDLWQAQVEDMLIADKANRGSVSDRLEARAARISKLTQQLLG